MQTFVQMHRDWYCQDNGSSIRWCSGEYHQLTSLLREPKSEDTIRQIYTLFKGFTWAETDSFWEFRNGNRKTSWIPEYMTCTYFHQKPFLIGDCNKKRTKQKERLDWGVSQWRTLIWNCLGLFSGISATRSLYEMVRQTIDEFIGLAAEGRFSWLTKGRITPTESSGALVDTRALHNGKLCGTIVQALSFSSHAPSLDNH